MSSKNSNISVIVPVYNQAQYLGEAIDSLLRQSLPPKEILVVDDGSKDDSFAVAEKFGPPVQAMRQDHGGISAARNLALEHATGEFIALCDADDICEPGRLQKQWELFEKDPHLHMAFCQVRQFLCPSLPAEDQHKYRCNPESQPGILPGSMLVRREVFERVGKFDETIKVAEFLDWYSRAKTAGLKETCHPETLYLRRIHGHNHGIRSQNPKAHYLKLLKANLDRKRNQASS